MLLLPNVGERGTAMRRLVAIHIKGGVAVSLWFLGALCVTAEVRQPGFWYDKVGRISKRSGDPVIRRSGDLSTKPDSNFGSQSVADNQPGVPSSPEPAYQNNEVAAEQQAAELPPQETPKQNAADSQTRQIVISIPDRRLALLVDGELVKVYQVAVGKDETPSPEGDFTIINHAVNPTYRHGDTEIGPGKDNPLGTRWMGLSLKGYGIHGTNVQKSVGKAASHGCFRMKKRDVEDLYGRVQVGDAVSIRGERDELTASLFGTGATPAPIAAGSKGTEVASAATQPLVSGTGQ
jgi:lipoprotein-anchoring transpeptidase ErfK/SrfK